MKPYTIRDKEMKKYIQAKLHNLDSLRQVREFIPIEMMYPRQKKYVGSPKVTISGLGGYSLVVRMQIEDLSGDRREIGVLDITCVKSSGSDNRKESTGDIIIDIYEFNIDILYLDLDGVQIASGILISKDDKYYKLLPSASPYSVVILPPEDSDLVSGPHYHGPECDINEYNIRTS